MNIEQIKQDQENGVMVSSVTYRKLVEAALLMRSALLDIYHYSKAPTVEYKGVHVALEEVEAL